MIANQSQPKGSEKIQTKSYEPECSCRRNSRDTLQLYIALKMPYLKINPKEEKKKFWKINNHIMAPNNTQKMAVDIQSYIHLT